MATAHHLRPPPQTRRDTSINESHCRFILHSSLKTRLALTMAITCTLDDRPSADARSRAPLSTLTPPPPFPLPLLTLLMKAGGGSLSLSRSASLSNHRVRCRHRRQSPPFHNVLRVLMYIMFMTGVKTTRPKLGQVRRGGGDDSDDALPEIAQRKHSLVPRRERQRQQPSRGGHQPARSWTMPGMPR